MVSPWRALINFIEHIPVETKSMPNPIQVAELAEAAAGCAAKLVEGTTASALVDAAYGTARNLRATAINFMDHAMIGGRTLVEGAADSTLPAGLKGEGLAAETAELFRQEANTSVPGKIMGAKPFAWEGDAATTLSARLAGMPPQAPMTKLVSAALDTEDSATIESVRRIFVLPAEARSLLTRGDIEHLTGLLVDASPANLAEARSTFSLVHELGAGMAPDATSAQVLNRVRQSGVLGDNAWLNRSVHMI
jgi:hypothetical protein